MQRLNRIALPVIALTTAFFLGAHRGYAAEAVKVGVVLPLTGEKAVLGKMEERAFGLAIEEINARRAQAGEPAIELIVEDDGGVPERALSVVEGLIKVEEVAMLSGGLTSRAAWVVAPVAQKLRVPFLITSASADKISEQGWDYVFRLSPPASEHQRALLSLLGEVVRPPRTVVIIHENSLDGLRRAQEMRALFRDSGYEITLRRGYERATEDFTGLLEAVRQRRPQVIYLASYLVDASELLRQARDQGMDSGLFVGSDNGLTSAQFYNRAGRAAERLLSSRLWMPSLPFRGAEAFAEEFKARFNMEADRYAAQAYAAAHVIDDALRRASSPQPQDLRRSLAEINLMTVIGPVSFVSYGKKTNQNRSSAYVVQWIDGRLEIVWPRKYATERYRPPR